jgi:hypothetical protein
VQVTANLALGGMEISTFTIMDWDSDADSDVRFARGFFADPRNRNFKIFQDIESAAFEVTFYVIQVLWMYMYKHIIIICTCMY